VKKGDERLFFSQQVDFVPAVLPVVKRLFDLQDDVGLSIDALRVRCDPCAGLGIIVGTVIDSLAGVGFDDNIQPEFHELGHRFRYGCHPVLMDHDFFRHSDNHFGIPFL